MQAVLLKTINDLRDNPTVTKDEALDQLAGLVFEQGFIMDSLNEENSKTEPLVCFYHNDPRGYFWVETEEGTAWIKDHIDQIRNLTGRICFYPVSVIDQGRRIGLKVPVDKEPLLIGYLEENGFIIK